MYNVCFMDYDNETGVIANPITHDPIAFANEADAWNFIEEFMKKDNCPRFMWTREVADADPGQPDHHLSYRT